MPATLPKMIICDICKVSFSKKSNLTRHSVNKHSLPRKQRVLNEVSFSKKSNLTRHSVNKHGLPRKQRILNDPNAFTCDFCEWKCMTKGGITKHIGLKHGVNKSAIKKKSWRFLCPFECGIQSTSMKGHIRHLVDAHQFQEQSEQREFESLEEFNEFKKELEEQQLSSFFKHSMNPKKEYFLCHRSGSRPESTKSVKIARECPAHLILSKKSDGRVSVKGQINHAGHTNSVQFLRLTRDDRAALAAKIEMGVDLDRILNETRNTLHPNEQLKRIHFVKKKDLRNIINEFNLKKYCRSRNDAESVDLWVQEQEVRDVSPTNLVGMEVEVDYVEVQQKFHHNACVLSASARADSHQDKIKQEEFKDLMQKCYGVIGTRSAAELANCNKALKRLLAAPSVQSFDTPKSGSFPSHAKLEKPVNFFSTKKKRMKAVTNFQKPSEAVKLALASATPGENSLNIHSGFDHSYDNPKHENIKAAGKALTRKNDVLRVTRQ